MKRKISLSENKIFESINMPRSIQKRWNKSVVYLSSILIVFLLVNSSAQASVTLVQSKGVGKYMGTSISATFWLGAPQAGNLLIAQVSNQTSQAPPNTPAGWSIAISETNGSPGQIIFYKIADGTEGKTITIDGYGTSDLLTLQIFEYTSDSFIGALDKTSSNTGTGTAISANSITTTNSEELIIAAVCENNGTSFTPWTNSFNAGIGFQVSGTPSLAASFADRVVSSTGTYSTSVTAQRSGTWRIQLVSFKTVKSWDGGAGTNNWADANNWNPNGVPNSTDDVGLKNASTIEINTPSACKSIIMKNPALSITLKSGSSFSVAGNFSLISGTFKTESSFPIVSGLIAIDSGTVEYSGSVPQTIAALNYHNLTLSGSDTKTFSSGKTSISGAFSVTGVPPGAASNSAVKTSSGGSDSRINSIIGTISINTTTNSSEIDYNGAGDQDVLAIDYYDLTLSNDGTKYFSSGTVGINKSLVINDLAVVDAITYNDTIDYYGAINKTVRYGFINKNLIISDSSFVTAEADIIVTNSLTITEGSSLDMNGYVLTVDSVFLNDGIYKSTNPTGVMPFYSRSSGNFNSLDSWSYTGYDGSPVTRLPGAINNDILIIGKGQSIDLTSNLSNLGTVIVDSGGTLNPASYAITGNGKFTIRKDGNLFVTSPNGLDLASGNIRTTFASLNQGANYVFKGTSAQVTGNRFPYALNNLTINNSNGVSLTNSARLSGNLSLTQGKLSLNSKNLILSTTSSILGTPSSSNMVVTNGAGQLRKEFNSDGSFTFPIGDNTGTAEYSPVTLNFTSGTFSSAYAGVNVVNAKHPQNTSTSNYLNRYWTVSSSGILDFSCDVTFNYVDADVQSGGNENNIYGAQYEGSWNLLDPVNPTANQIFYTVSSFSDFTGGESTALPVELVSFNASVANNSVNLNWKTATEVNNYGFEIERSQTSNVKSQNWEKIGFVNGNGNSNSLKEYSFTDSKLASGSYSYRLKQIDNDGSFTYSHVVNVTIDNSPNSFELYQNYPNPFNPSTKIKYAVTEESFVTIKVYNILGSEVAALVNKTVPAGNYEVNFNASELASGTYIYKIQAGSFSDTKKMVLTK